MEKKTQWTMLAVAGILTLAAFFRFYDIKNYPPGLFPDEAANGEDVQLILDGDWRPFYPRGNGREGLFFYLQAASVKAFGVGVWQMHIVSAAVGVATVFFIFLAASVWLGTPAGLFAAAMLATNHWHVTLSRTGFRAILIPFFIALFTALAGLAVKTRSLPHSATSLRVNPTSPYKGEGLASLPLHKGEQEGVSWLSYLYAALAGAAFAGGFYTYIAYRVMIGVAGGMLLLWLLLALVPAIGFKPWRRYGKHLLIALLAGIVVISPLAIYFVRHPEAFAGRAGQVSVFSRELKNQYGGGTLAGTVLYSARETLLSFFIGKGDLNWRHNVAGFPLLNPLAAGLFVAGFIWMVYRMVEALLAVVKGKAKGKGLIFPYCLLLLGGMLLPVITTAEGMPHGLRSAGLIAPIFIMAGAGAALIKRWGGKRQAGERRRALVFGLVMGVFVLAALYDGALYFLIARNSPQAAFAYRGDLTEVSKYLNDYRATNSAAPRPYLALDKFSLQTVHFLTTVAAHDYTNGDEPHPDEPLHKWRQVDPEKAEGVVMLLGEVIVFTQSSLPDAERYFKRYAGTLELLESRRNRFGEEIMRVYKAKATQEDRSDLDA